MQRKNKGTFEDSLHDVCKPACSAQRLMSKSREVRPKTNVCNDCNAEASRSPKMFFSSQRGKDDPCNAKISQLQKRCQNNVTRATYKI